MRTHDVDTVIDVGANTGQYALELREIGFTGDILSFEPLSDAYEELARHAAFDPRWRTANLAIGASNHSAEINVSENSQSSSLLKILPITLEAAPTARYVGRQRVEVQTLDSMLDQFLPRQSRAYLKIDAQGYERQVLDGARLSLADRIVGVQVECSLVPLYEAEAPLEDMLAFMKQRGYSLMSIEPEFSNDATGQLLQADLIFYRDNSFDTPTGGTRADVGLS